MTTERVVRLARLRRMCRDGTARSIRLAAGITLAEVARSMGVRLPTVYRWEMGQRMPSEALALTYLGLLEDLSQVSRHR